MYQRLPFAELHVHLEGTLEPELIFELAARNHITLPYRDLADLRSRYEFTDLQSFLDLYYANMQVLQTEADFFDLTEAYLSRAARAGVRRAEVFVDLQAHTERGLEPSQVLGGVHRALAGSQSRHGISSGLIVTFLRHLSGESAWQAYQQVRASSVPVLGVGLCSTEVGNPAGRFAEVFAQAQADGLHTVAHAGEEGGPEYVWDALDILQVERIDHGIRAVEDPALVARLVAQQIPLTVCPLSNLRLKAVRSLPEHPLPELLRQGVAASVHSDDPAYFGGYLDDNIAAIQAAVGLSAAEVRQLARNSIEASFATAEEKALLLAELNAG